MYRSIVDRSSSSSASSNVRGFRGEVDVQCMTQTAAFASDITSPFCASNLMRFLLFIAHPEEPARALVSSSRSPTHPSASPLSRKFSQPTFLSLPSRYKYGSFHYDQQQCTSLLHLTFLSSHVIHVTLERGSGCTYHVISPTDTKSSSSNLRFQERPSCRLTFDEDDSACVAR